MLKIIKDFPPNIEEIRKRFKLHPGIIFTYAPNIYNPDNGTLDVPLIVHEETHIKQQKNSPKEWWSQYLSDDSFRLQQEVEAYQSQYQSMLEVYKDKNYLAKRVHQIAIDLSSSIYGNILSYREAKNLITK